MLLSYRLWFLTFFVGLGIIVPQFSSYIYDSLNFKNPGYLFLLLQILFPIGAFLAGYFSDKTLQIRNILILKSTSAAILIFLITFVSYITNNQATKELFTVILFSMYALMLGGIIPLINVSFMQSGLNKNDFGKTRMFGTIGFLLPNLFLSFTSQFNFTPTFLIRLTPIFFLLSIIFLFFIPAKRKIHENTEKINLTHVKNLLTSPLFLGFLFVSFIFYIHFSPIDHILSSFLKKIPFTLEPVPFSWLLGTSVEIIFLYFSPFLLSKMHPLIFAGISYVLGPIRLFILGYSSNNYILIFSGLLHGVHFIPSYLGNLMYLEQKSKPEYLGTAQSIWLLFGRATGIGIGAFFLGNIASTGNYILSFQIAGYIGLLGLFSLILFYFWQKNKPKSF